MLKKTCSILFLLFLTIGCKKDQKKTTLSSEEEKITVTKKGETKAYNFFSKAEDLNKLYKSDAWNMMLADAKKIGLQHTQVAQLDSIYFIHYSITNTKTSIFDQRMEALPAFKNFREMSQSITGDTLDYHSELKALFQFHSNTISTNKPKTVILYTSLNTENNKKSFPTELFLNTPPSASLENYIRNNMLSSLELYNQNNRFFAVISGKETTSIKQFIKNLRWDVLFEKEGLTNIQKNYPNLDIDAPVFENWTAMTPL